AVFGQHRRIGCLVGCTFALTADRRRHMLAGTLRERLCGHTGAGEHLSCRYVLTQYEREEEVLGIDVGGTGRAGDLVGVEERSTRARSDPGGVRVCRVAR